MMVASGRYRISTDSTDRSTDPVRCPGFTPEAFSVERLMPSVRGFSFAPHVVRGSDTVTRTPGNRSRAMTNTTGCAPTRRGEVPGHKHLAYCGSPASADATRGREESRWASRNASERVRSVLWSSIVSQDRGPVDRGLHMPAVEETTPRLTIDPEPATTTLGVCSPRPYHRRRKGEVSPQTKPTLNENTPARSDLNRGGERADPDQ